eukprot:EC825806.1.p1 GENE.EC825806.1~~EC825806.1.p1  ORF type:complete len:166 (+),score=57.11 EC825806.1:93-590(+)
MINEKYSYLIKYVTRCNVPECGTIVNNSFIGFYDLKTNKNIYKFEFEDYYFMTSYFANLNNFHITENNDLLIVGLSNVIDKENEKECFTEILIFSFKDLKLVSRTKDFILNCVDTRMSSNNWKINNNTLISTLSLYDSKDNVEEIFLNEFSIFNGKKINSIEKKN